MSVYKDPGWYDMGVRRMRGEAAQERARADGQKARADALERQLTKSKDEAQELRKVLAKLLEAQKSTVWPGQGKKKAKLIRDAASVLDVDPNLFLDRHERRQ